jgi:hypothetical protein
MKPGLKNQEYGRRDPSRWPCGTLYPQKLALTSPTSGSRSFGIVRSRNEATEFSFSFYVMKHWKVKKVKCLCLSNLSPTSMKMYGGMDVQNQFFFTWTLDGGEWSASRPGSFTSGKSIRYPLYRMLGEPQSPSGRHGDKKILNPTGTRTSTPRSSIQYAIAITIEPSPLHLMNH